MIKVNKTFLRKALHDGTLTIEALPDGNLSDFLKLLKENQVGEVVVFGGAVRDIFLNQSIAGIDVTVKRKFVFQMNSEITS